MSPSSSLTGKTTFGRHRTSILRGYHLSTLPLVLCGNPILHVHQKTGPAIHNITTTEEAERIPTSHDKVVLGFFNSLVAIYGGWIKHCAMDLTDPPRNMHQSRRRRTTKKFEGEERNQHA